MDIHVNADGTLRADGLQLRCALGRSGIRSDKAEGDGATPTGCFALRRVLYRPDRVDAPETALATLPIARSDGWCDAAGDPAYNRPVTLPYPASAETMWREDRLYDVVVVLGHNDDPPVAGLGSAIFMHVARPDYAPTEGCVALALPDLLTVLRQCAPGDRICVSAPDGCRR
jgi:L,D-peptidoglycan transpeptidase YkuD (ErfK/YbiS/YcfS/YnhG family)